MMLQLALRSLPYKARDLPVSAINSFLQLTLHVCSQLYKSEWGDF